MNPKSIATNFLQALAAARAAASVITIKLSLDPSLNLPTTDSTVEGKNWFNDIDPSQKYDFVVADLSFGMNRKKSNIGSSTINARENWIEPYCYL